LLTKTPGSIELGFCEFHLMLENFGYKVVDRIGQLNSKRDFYHESQV